MLSNTVISAIRTYVPIAVGLVLTWLAQRLHIVIDPASQAGLVALLVSALTAGYWLLAKLLEKLNPKFGWLLGYPSAPNYAGSTTSTNAASTTEDYDLTGVDVVDAPAVQ